MIIEQITEFLFGHDCYEYAEMKNVWYHNIAGVPNPLSIYGPRGSYWAIVHYCKKCGRYWAYGYDTYGGLNIRPEAAQQMFKTGKPIMALSRR